MGSQEPTVLNNSRVAGNESLERERYIPGCLCTCIFVHSILQRPRKPHFRGYMAMKAKRNFSCLPSLNYRTKEIVCTSFLACVQRACECLSEWAGVTLCSFI